MGVFAKTGTESHRDRGQMGTAQKQKQIKQLAKNALGGLLPAGVSHSNINDAVNIINVGFD